MEEKFIKIWPLDGSQNWQLFTMNKQDMKDMMDECWDNPNFRFEIVWDMGRENAN